METVFGIDEAVRGIVMNPARVPEHIREILVENYSGGTHGQRVVIKPVAYDLGVGCIQLCRVRSPLERVVTMIGGAPPLYAIRSWRRIIEDRNSAIRSGFQV